MRHQRIFSGRSCKCGVRLPWAYLGAQPLCRVFVRPVPTTRLAISNRASASVYRSSAWPWRSPSFYENAYLRQAMIIAPPKTTLARAPIQLRMMMASIWLPSHVPFRCLYSSGRTFISNPRAEAFGWVQVQGSAVWNRALQPIAYGWPGILLHAAGTWIPIAHGHPLQRCSRIRACDVSPDFHSFRMTAY